jgi:hypothetical protein
LIVTTVPGAPLEGLNEVIDSVGVEFVLLVELPCASVTEIADGTAPFGTTAVSFVPDEIVTFGDVSVPKLILTAAANAAPVTVTLLPVIPDEGVNEAIVGAP